jgi:hypothetical protein
VIPLVSLSNFMLDSLCLKFGTRIFDYELQVPMRVPAFTVPD